MSTRVLSGMQPSGRMHLGNLLGALENFKRLQAEYECFYFIADWHALSTNYEDTSHIREWVRDMLMDWLASGIDPARATLFVQSRVPEHAVLHLLLSMITPVPWLERNPTYKEKQENIDGRDLSSYGFLGYPILQAADILLYKGNLVPVGVDQLPHLELTREITRRFNSLYKPIFPEPQALLTAIPKVPGTDGRKMSKSYNNAVFLSEPAADVDAKLSRMMTDPRRVRRTDPGDPKDCPAYQSFHKIYCTPDELAYVDKGCKTAAIGCLECKKIMIRHVLEDLKPIQERRREIDAQPSLVNEVLEDGNRRAHAVAGETMREVRDAVGLV